MLEQKFYTVADVANVTGLTSRTIRNYIKDGMLHGRKIGVQWRFTEEDINQLFSDVDFSEKLTVLQDNLVSEFLSETIRTEQTDCLIVDLPYGSKKRVQRCMHELKQLLTQEKDSNVKFAYEYMDDNGFVRIVLSGEPDEVQKTATWIKEGLMNTDAE